MALAEGTLNPKQTEELDRGFCSSLLFLDGESQWRCTNFSGDVAGTGSGFGGGVERRQRTRNRRECGGTQKGAPAAVR